MSTKLKVNYVDHISIAVKDIEAAIKNYKDAFGWEVDGRYNDFDENIKVAYYMVGPTAVELMQDIDGTGEVAKFIKRSGEGVMLISYSVNNCDEALQILKSNGTKLIDTKPRYAKELNRKFAFIHPKACHGILTEVIDGKY